MTPDIYIDAVIKLKNQSKAYDEINHKIANLQYDNDFFNRLHPMDNAMETCFVDVLDDVLFSLSGVSELASYYLYESNWEIHDTDKRVYKWKDDEGFRKNVIQMIKDKNGC